ncbi:MAG: hydantoinase/carbamoylase family amidase, partial [Acidobacteriota bacterium]
GAYTRDWAYAREDRRGETFGVALEKIGYRGTERCGDRKLSAFFEVHIEQGPFLEAEGKAIGVVTGVQAMRWYEMTITGQDSHAGTTPMRGRRDALLGAARVVEAVNDCARQFPEAVGTVGLLETKPGSPNVIPGEVYLTLDLRDPDAAIVERMETEILGKAKRIAEEIGLAVTTKTILNEPALQFNPECVAAIRAAADASGFSRRDIISRAWHDAAYVSRIAPTAMIFVPCRDGISHNEAEFSSKEQCAAGAQVLLQAVLEYDRQLADRLGDK